LSRTPNPRDASSFHNGSCVFHPRGFQQNAFLRINPAYISFIFIFLFFFLRSSYSSWNCVTITLLESDISSNCENTRVIFSRQLETNLKKTLRQNQISTRLFLSFYGSCRRSLGVDSSPPTELFPYILLDRLFKRGNIILG
jgi:hypothetical protein